MDESSAICITLWIEVINSFPLNCRFTLSPILFHYVHCALPMHLPASHAYTRPFNLIWVLTTTSSSISRCWKTPSSCSKYLGLATALRILWTCVWNKRRRPASATTNNVSDCTLSRSEFKYVYAVSGT